MHHGWGGGTRSDGGNINKYMRTLARYDYDIGIFGHTHQGWTITTPRISSESKGLYRRLTQKKQITGNVPSFLKTLSDDENPTYSEIKGYFPVLMGWIEIQIEPRENNKFGYG